MKYAAKAFFIIELFILGFKYFHLPVYQKETLLIYLMFAVLNLVVFFRAHKKVRVAAKYSIITYLFSIGYFIVFFQRYFDLLFGFRQPFDPSFSDESTIMKCVVISLSGQCAFMLGNLLSSFKKAYSVTKYTYTKIRSLKTIFICADISCFHIHIPKIHWQLSQVRWFYIQQCSIKLPSP